MRCFLRQAARDKSKDDHGRTHRYGSGVEKKSLRRGVYLARSSMLRLVLQSLTICLLVAATPSATAVCVDWDTDPGGDPSSPVEAGTAGFGVYVCIYQNCNTWAVKNRCHDSALVDTSDLLP